MSLPIGSIEGFVLSRIDGTVSLEDLADLVGLSSDQVEAAVRRLAALGAIRIEQPNGAPGSTTVATRSARPDSFVREPGPGPSPALGEDEEVDLGTDRKAKVLGLYAGLPTLDFYSLLGIQDIADKNEVKRAYFALSKLVHPDTMFGKRLGSYKPKMEAIFNRATEAYETLSRRRRREEYDASIGLPPLAERLEKAPTPPQDAPPSAPSVPSPKGKGGRSAPPVRASSKPSSSPSSVRPRPGAARGSGAPVSPLLSTPTEVKAGPSSVEARFERPVRTAPSEARREAQRRIAGQIAKMTGRPLTAPPRDRDPKSQRPPEPAEGDSRHGRASALRGLAGSLRDASRHTGAIDRVQKHLNVAKAAEDEGDLAGATQMLRIAHDLFPDREDVAAEYRRLRLHLARSQADSYETQAAREEGMEMWGAAAISWSRVAEGRPDDPSPHVRAAHCLWRSKGDLRKARALALRAVELSPTSVDARLALARVYVTAEMAESARRELAAAAKLDPNHEIVKNLLRELKT